MFGVWLLYHVHWKQSKTKQLDCVQQMVQLIQEKQPSTELIEGHNFTVGGLQVDIYTSRGQCVHLFITTCMCHCELLCMFEALDLQNDIWVTWLWALK